MEFAKNNPEVTIYVRERNGKHPRIVANFSKLLFSFSKHQIRHDGLHCRRSRLILKKRSNISLEFLRYFSISLSVNGNSKIVDVKNKTPEEINEWVDRLRHESGVKVQKIRQFWHTENPSIQGTWTPFLNKPPSLRRSTVNGSAAQKQSVS